MEAAPTHPAAVDDAGKLRVVHPARQGHAAEAAVVCRQEQGIKVAAGEGEEGQRGGQAGLLQAGTGRELREVPMIQKGTLAAGARPSTQCKTAHCGTRTATRHAAGHWQGVMCQWFCLECVHGKVAGQQICCLPACLTHLISFFSHNDRLDQGRDGGRGRGRKHAGQSKGRQKVQWQAKGLPAHHPPGCTAGCQMCRQLAWARRSQGPPCLCSRCGSAAGRWTRGRAHPGVACGQAAGETLAW